MPFGVVQRTVYSFSFGSKQKFINKNIICNEPNLPITTPIYKNDFLLYAWSHMTVKARRTWALLDLQQSCISNLVWTGLLDPCGSLLINNAVFRLERFTEVGEFTYLGKHFPCVNANWYFNKCRKRQKKFDQGKSCNYPVIRHGYSW